MENKVKKFELLKSIVQCTFDVNETLQLLKLKTIWLMSWGARNFEQFQSKALLFRVSGHHHNGYVIITLAGNDTYSVTFANLQWEVVETKTEIYFDMLSEVIDERVERVKAYNS